MRYGSELSTPEAVPSGIAGLHRNTCRWPVVGGDSPSTRTLKASSVSSGNLFQV